MAVDTVIMFSARYMEIRMATTLSLWQQAADQGLEAAQMEMGHSLYSNGTGNLDDYPEALRLFRLAAA